MSISSQVARTGPFLITALPQTVPVGFPFQQGSDLTVLDIGPVAAPKAAVTLTLGSDYTVTGGGYNPFTQMLVGSIVVVAGGVNSVALNDQLVILRNVPINQTSSLSPTEPLTVQVIEKALDKQATISQELQEEISRTLIFPPGEFINGLLPLASRKGNLLGFDGNGRVAFYQIQTGAVPVGTVLEVQNIASLQAISVTSLSSGTTVFVAGYYAPSDGGGGLFYYNSTSPSTPNGGTVIAPNSGAGKWIRVVLDDEIDVRMFGAKGDDATDDTAAIQSCFTNVPGLKVNFGSGNIYLITSTLTISSGTSISGYSTIKAKSSSSIAGAMLYASGATGLLITQVQFNANGDAAGATHGIELTGGTGNSIIGVYVHDTIQAGLRISSESNGVIQNNRIINCGRNGFTDNHGIMLFSTSATSLKDMDVSGNFVDTAYRKGITTYSATPGTVLNVTIENNRVINCGLGGIYVANAPATTDQKGIVVTGNVLDTNYVNIEFANVTGGSVTGNVSRNAAHLGLTFDGTSATAISGNTDQLSAIHGILVTNSTNPCLNLTITGNVIDRPNRSGAGTGVGIYITPANQCIISDNLVADTSGGTLMTHAILEEGASDNNLISDNLCFNATSALVTTIGASTTVRTTATAKEGFRTGIPANTVDINGGLSVRDQVLTLVNGANNNITLPTYAGTLYTAGPTGAYSITGLAGGSSGRIIVIVNNVAQTLTVAHNSGSSSAGNKILIGGAADITVSQFGSVTLQYLSGTSAWSVVSYKQ